MMRGMSAIFVFDINIEFYYECRADYYEIFPTCRVSSASVSPLPLHCTGYALAIIHYDMLAF